MAGGKEAIPFAAEAQLFMLDGEAGGGEVRFLSEDATGGIDRAGADMCSSSGKRMLSTA